MFFVIRPIVKHFAIKRYCRELGSLLAKRYGRSKYYTIGQVRRTIEECGFNRYYACYAYALFAERDAFNNFHLEIGESCNYDAMLSEIGQGHFGGQENFHDSFIDSVFESCSWDHGGHSSDHGGDSSHDSGD